MAAADTGHTEDRKWSAAAAAWTLLIFASVPVVRSGQRWVQDNLGAELFGYAVIATVLGAALLSLRAFRSRRQTPAGRSLLVTGACAAVAIIWTVTLWERPEEAIHIPEYGVLGLLVNRALRPRVRDGGLYIVAALVVGLVGNADEIIQWITPGRFWDFRDLAINAGAGALAQVAIWGAGGPLLLAPRWRASSRRLICRLALAQLVVLALCVVNTPQRVAWYAHRLLPLRFLAANQSVMCEYGHRHVFPGLGEFKSRFTLAELKTIDATRATAAAAILDSYPHHRYGAFLRHFPSARDPFVHEARVHVFNRDSHLREASLCRQDPICFSRHMTVAYRENQILEAFFPATLTSSARRLEGRRREAVVRHHVSSSYVVSKAGSHLVTSVSESQVLAALGCLALLCIAGATRPPGPPPAGPPPRQRTGRSPDRAGPGTRG